MMFSNVVCCWRKTVPLFKSSTATERSKTGGCESSRHVQRILTLSSSFAPQGFGSMAPRSSTFRQFILLVRNLPSSIIDDDRTPLPYKESRKTSSVSATAAERADSERNLTRKSTINLRPDSSTEGRYKWIAASFVYDLSETR
jgi:hypothetical protein